MIVTILKMKEIVVLPSLPCGKSMHYILLTKKCCIFGSINYFKCY
jgi:hypothetical protein